MITIYFKRVMVVINNCNKLYRFLLNSLNFQERMRVLNYLLAGITEIIIWADNTFMSWTFNGISSTSITDKVSVDFIFSVLSFLDFAVSYFAFLDNFLFNFRNYLRHNFLDFFRNGIFKVREGLLFLFLFLLFLLKFLSLLFFFRFFFNNNLLSFIKERLFSFVNFNFNFSLSWI